MAEIFPRIDILECPRRHTDLPEVERLDESVDREIDESRLTLDGATKCVRSSDESEVLPASFEVNRDGAVRPGPGEQRRDGVVDVWMVTGQHDHAFRGHVGQRGANAGGGASQGRILTNDDCLPNEWNEAVVAHNHNAGRVSDRGERSGQQSPAIDDDGVLGRPTQPPVGAAG